MPLSPNIWSLGDRAEFKDGRFWVPVTVRGFPGDLVRVELPDGARRRVPHGALRRAG